VRLERRHLGGLLLVDVLGLEVAAEEDRQRRDRREDQAPRNERFPNSLCLPFSTYQALMLMMKKAPMMKHPMSTCIRRWTVEGLKTSCQKSVISARICGTPSMSQALPSRWMIWRW
jgi:hypothetical protein